ncbi:hypothetical protein [Microbacterium sp.]|uniref:hypothetical protein n=1 Tax=Microbacterium sp. TaxID=51671 RepID=UPI0025D125C9|nr:hypothetical protein [Microbacterium sp.]
MRRSLTLTAIAIAALALSACAGASTAGSSGSPSESTRPPFRTTEPSPLAPSGTPTTVSAARWTAILDDLAARGVGGVPEIVSAEEVVFGDSSLGCPTPGVSYTQSLVDGLRVIVRVDGAQYDYRFGSSDAPTLCRR